MTLSFERARAVQQAAQLLKDLVNPRSTPKVPKHVRDRAYHILRHYPSLSDLILVEEAWSNETLRTIAECPFATKDSLIGTLQ